MEKLSNVITTVSTAKFKVTKEKINQVEARTLKSAFNDALENAFIELGLETTKSDKGFLVRVPNEIEGSVTINVDTIIKPLSFDFDQAVADQAAKLVKAAKGGKA